MLESDLRIGRFLLGYCRMLLADIPDERLTEQPLPGINHPAWILGHLAMSADGAAQLCGGEKRLSPEFYQLYGRGSGVTALRGDYPSKSELLGAVESGFERAFTLAAAVTPEVFAAPSAPGMLQQGLPTVGDRVAFLFTGHLAMHLGQLSSWRRMIGLPHLF